MRDGTTVDQVRTFLAAVDEGSFSAAGRRLGRAQSVVSQTLITIEQRLGIALFDRSGRYPVLTEAGRSLVADARAVVGAMARLKGRAAQLVAGLEPEVAVTIDVMVPLAIVARAATAFEAAFPNTALKLSIEVLGAVVRPVIDGSDAFAIAGPLAMEHATLASKPFPGVPMMVVAAPAHPAAAQAITRRELAAYRQLVLSDRSDLSRGRQFGVLSSLSWRLSDLGAKHALLKAGLGWGAMPQAMIANDLAKGSLVPLDIVDADPAWSVMPMHIVHPLERPPGIAGRWLMDGFRDEASRALVQ